MGPYRRVRTSTKGGRAFCGDGGCLVAAWNEQAKTLARAQAVPLAGSGDGD